MEQLLREFPVGREGASTDWRAAENELGVHVSTPCRQLVERYAHGCFDDFIWVFHPQSSNENLNLVHKTEEVRWVLGELVSPAATQILEEHQISVNDLVAWGATGNGDFCFSVDPDEAPGSLTLVCDPRGPEWEAFELEPGDFLGRVLAGDITCSIFPDDFPSEDPGIYFEQ